MSASRIFQNESQNKSQNESQNEPQNESQKDPLQKNSQKPPQKNQWECIRPNIGVWHGSFMQFSPEGLLEKETPSVLTLEETALNKTMALTLVRSPTGAPPKNNRLTFTAPGPAPSIYFFESGAFAQGSAQWSALGQFGTEFSITLKDRRIRFVIMYEGSASYSSKLRYVTLIGETKADAAPFADQSTDSANPFSPLSGHWHGSAEQLEAKTRAFSSGGSTTWQLAHTTKNAQKHLSLVCEERFTHTAHKLQLSSDEHTNSSDSPQIITFAQQVSDGLTYQMMRLPKGAYCLLPREIKRDSAFRIEVGWLNEQDSSAQQRTRFIRYYNRYGTWTGSALIVDVAA